jgi:hypothetical protein
LSAVLGRTLYTHNPQNESLKEYYKPKPVFSRGNWGSLTFENENGGANVIPGRIYLPGKLTLERHFISQWY